VTGLYYFPNAADIASARRTCQALEQAIAIGALNNIVPAEATPHNQEVLGAAATLLRALEDGAVRQSAWDLSPLSRAKP